MVVMDPYYTFRLFTPLTSWRLVAIICWLVLHLQEFKLPTASLICCFARLAKIERSMFFDISPKKTSTEVLSHPCSLPIKVRFRFSEDYFHATILLTKPTPTNLTRARRVCQRLTIYGNGSTKTKLTRDGPYPMDGISPPQFSKESRRCVRSAKSGVNPCPILVAFD